jgi:hypothetical protein
MKTSFVASPTAFDASARARRLDGMAMQQIEQNPLSEDQVAMFEMFESRGWSHEQRRDYLAARLGVALAKPAE